MKKLLLALVLLLVPASAYAQCNGIYPASTACGTVAGGVPGPIPFSAIGGGRVRLLTNTTFHVSSTGNDGTCTGTALLPCLTWNRLYEVVASLYDFNTETVTLTSDTVTSYTAGLFMNTAWVGGGQLIIDGGGATLNETVTKGIINNVIQPGYITIQNITVSSTAFSCIQNAAPGLMNVLANVTIGTCNEDDFEAVNGGQIFIQNNYTVTGASGAGNAGHLRAAYGGQITDNGQATFTTNRSYTVGFANTFEGNIQAPNFTSSLGGNTITGPRYAALQGGNIYTNTNASPNFFPGSVAGTISPGGCYDTTCVASTVVGGSAANSGTTISSTTNASPSGDFVSIAADTVNLGGITGGGAVTINLGNSGSHWATLNFSGSTSGFTSLVAPAVAGAAIVLPSSSGTLALASAANVASVSNSDGTLTISPTTGVVVASLALGHVNTWSGQQTFVAPILGAATGTSLALGGASIGSNALAVTGSSALGGAVSIQSTAANAFAVSGATNSGFIVDESTASAATGIKIKAAAAGGGVAISAITTAGQVNDNLSIDAAGSGTITLGGVSTGAIVLTRATTLSAALTYGGVILSNSVSGTGSMALTAGTTFTGTTTVATLAATTINAFTAGGAIAMGGNNITGVGILGAGTTTITSSGNCLTMGPNGSTNPLFTADCSAGSLVAGLRVAGAATGGTVNLLTTDSGSNNNLAFNAKGTGTITFGSVSTGQIILTPDVSLGGQHFQPNITTSSAAQTGTVCWTTGTGKFTVDTTVGCLTSIMAAKNITERLSPAKALDIISRLDPFAFRYKKGWGDSGRYEQFGLGAEEVALVDERLVGRDPTGALQGVRYQEGFAVTAGAIQGVMEKVQKLEADNDNMRSDIASLKKASK